MDISNALKATTPTNQNSTHHSPVASITKLPLKRIFNGDSMSTSTHIPFMWALERIMKKTIARCDGKLSKWFVSWQSVLYQPWNGQQVQILRCYFFCLNLPIFNTSCLYRTWTSPTLKHFIWTLIKFLSNRKIRKSNEKKRSKKTETFVIFFSSFCFDDDSRLLKNSFLKSQKLKFFV